MNMNHMHEIVAKYCRLMDDEFDVTLFVVLIYRISNVTSIKVQTSDAYKKFEMFEWPFPTIFNLSEITSGGFRLTVPNILLTTV